MNFYDIWRRRVGYSFSDSLMGAVMLHLSGATRSAVVVFCSVTVSLAAQQPAAPAFEVVSIKPNAGGGATEFGQRTAGRFVMVNGNVRALIAFGHDLNDADIERLPNWAESDRFDVTAKAPDGTPDRDLRPMVRSLLAERFKLVTHVEQRQKDVYALLIADKGRGLGPHLRKIEANCDDLFESFRSGRVALEDVPRASNGSLVCSQGGGASFGSVAVLSQSTGIRMQQFARSLRGVVGRPVLDRTELAGFDEYTLKRAVDCLAPLESAPCIFVALQEQLGLRLEATRGPVDVVVIDSVERPTPD